MQAVQIAEFGIQNLTVEELSDPVPAAGEVLIATEAATINPADAAVVSGAAAPGFPPGFKPPTRPPGPALTARRSFATSFGLEWSYAAAAHGSAVGACTAVVLRRAHAGGDRGPARGRG
jgi:NADPH:quinone reductase